MKMLRFLFKADNKNRNVVIVQSWLLLFGIAFINDVTLGAPKNRPQKAGPCIGMDCLHGVLMHGDSEQGDTHQGEDTYDRLQREDKSKQNKEKLGPCEGDDCLHELLHTDKDIKHALHSKMGPELEQTPGVEEGMDYLHGVLMHGDSKPGLTHKLEDADKQKKEGGHEPDGPCLDCLQGRLHSTHLERDTADEEDETEHHDEKQPSPGIFDPDQLLHPDGSDHSPKQTADDTVLGDRPKPLVFDPDQFLHPDGSDHSPKQPADDADLEDRPKPLVFDPDKLLHADGESHDGQMNQKETEAKVYPKSGTYDLESVLHGQADAESLHHKGVEEQEEDTAAHQNKQGQKAGTFDPDALLHGGDQHAHDHEKKQAAEQVELGKVADEHEHDDFKRWMAEKIRKGEAMEKEGGMLGFSKPFISDTVLDDIDQMKQRYVLKDWGGDAEERDVQAEEDSSVDEGESEEDWEWEDEEEEGGVENLIEETEEVKAQLEEFEDELSELREKVNVHDRRSRESVEHDDMRHELENIGSTKALRSDVDIMLDNQGQKKTKRERDNGL